MEYVPSVQAVDADAAGAERGESKTGRRLQEEESGWWMGGDARRRARDARSGLGDARTPARTARRTPHAVPPTHCSAMQRPAQPLGGKSRMHPLPPPVAFASSHCSASHPVRRQCVRESRRIGIGAGSASTQEESPHTGPHDGEALRASRAPVSPSPALSDPPCAASSSTVHIVHGNSLPSIPLRSVSSLP